MTPQYLRELTRQAAQQSIEVIRRRIDPTGASEVTIVRQGDDRIIVQAPGLTDPEQLKNRIGQTALMTFHMVREVDAARQDAGPLPPGTMLVQPYPGVGDRADVVERRPRFTGERLADARPSSDPQTGQIVFSFRLDSQGARQFCRISREYTGQRFAILLDNQVLTAPTINEPICGGSGQISGNFTPQAASELAVMLRAGALPAPLSMIEERSVGCRAWAGRDRRGRDGGHHRQHRRRGVHGARLWHVWRVRVPRSGDQHSDDRRRHVRERRHAHACRALPASC